MFPSLSAGHELAPLLLRSHPAIVNFLDGIPETPPWGSERAAGTHCGPRGCRHSALSPPPRGERCRPEPDGVRSPCEPRGPVRPHARHRVTRRLKGHTCEAPDALAVAPPRHQVTAPSCNPLTVDTRRRVPTPVPQEGGHRDSPPRRGPGQLGESAAPQGRGPDRAAEHQRGDLTPGLPVLPEGEPLVGQLNHRVPAIALPRLQILGVHHSASTTSRSISAI